MRDHRSEAREGENETRGGSSETDVSELTISPAGSPPGAAATNATPVAKAPSASRNDRAGGDPSVQRRGFSEGHGGEVVIRTVGSERVHERAGADIAVGAGQRAAVEIAG